MDILITGGAGFIGSNLANRLNKEGNDVTVLDNLSLGSKDNLNEGIEIVEGSTSDENLVSSLVKDKDVVFHLAAPSSAPMYESNPSLLKDNLDGFINVLMASSDNSTRLVYASTSSMYNGNEVPFTESQVIRPKTLYESVFYCREQIARAYSLQKGFKSVGLRFFSVYGPNETHKGKYANIITQFLWEMKSGRRPLIYGDGSQFRDFTHVDDIVEGLILASEYDEFGIFNLGRGEEHSFNEIVSILNSKLGTSIDPTYTENPIHNYVHSTLASTDLAKEKLGFNASVSLKDGIEQLVKEY